ncbi:Cytochrome P450 monooxygenase dtxS2 [Cladobotryum mycophilum]|uniref:Cytochrome P450 monooxygenase dtxS2 n=1 Tax=Cladobotryum mycophilum TaxID=491253 RepID=A0ABR0SZ53_9HYPO
MESLFTAGKPIHLTHLRLVGRGRLEDILENWDHSQTIRTLSILAGLFIAHRIAMIIHNVWFHPLSKFPGPTLMAAFYFPFLWHSYLKGDMARRAAELHRKYGSVVRVSPNHLAVDGDVAWPEVFAHKSGKPEFGKVPGFFFPGDHYSLIGAPKEDHRRQRRQLSHAFSDAALKEQEETLYKYFDMFFAKLSQHADSGTTINFVDWMNFTTFDIIGDLCLSDSFHCLDNNGYHPWVHSIFQAIRGDSAQRFLDAYPILSYMSKFFKLSPEYEVAQRNRALGGKLAIERIARGETPGRRDFLSYMTRQTRNGEAGLSQNEILATTPLVILAGSETTATAMSGLVFYLCSNPEVYQRLAKEVREAFAADEDINLVSTGKLEYLHACLEEVLRVYPLLPRTPTTLSRCYSCRTLCSRGRKFKNPTLPKTTIIHTYQWATFRNPKNFADANSFRPERWLPESHAFYDAKFKNDNRAAFKPFSFGARDCIGKNLAYSELRVVTSKLLWRFDVTLEPGQEMWHEKQRTFTVWEKGPLNITLKDRRKE